MGHPPAVCRRLAGSAKRRAGWGSNGDGCWFGRHLEAPAHQGCRDAPRRFRGNRKCLSKCLFRWY